MSEWKEYKIGDMCLKVTDGAHNSPPEVTEGYPMFSVKDMDENGFDFSDVKLISRNDFDKLVKSDCKPLKNDVLIAKDGSYLKHVFVCKEEKEEVILSSIAILRPNVKIVNAFFLKYILKTSSVKNMMEGFVSGSALPRIVLKDFKKMVLQIPSVPTQHRIAYILSAYDDLIENNNRRIALLEQMAEQIYKEWFVRMRFPGYEKTEFEKGVPKGWEVTKVEKAFKYQAGGTPSREIDAYWKDGDINWFTPTDITGSKGYFLESSSEKCNEFGVSKSSAKLFPAYSLMMTSRATIGAIGINTKVACTNQGFITCIPNKKLPLTFLFYWLKLNKEFFISLSTGATFAELTKSAFKRVDIIIPDTEVVKNYDDIVKPIFNQLQNLQLQIQTLKQTRDLLLPRLISGKLKVNELKEFELV